VTHGQQAWVVQRTSRPSESPGAVQMFLSLSCVMRVGDSEKLWTVNDAEESRASRQTEWGPAGRVGDQVPVLQR
jgi:hypothetical protein